MDKQIVSYFFEEVAKTFEFLVREHAFHAPQVNVEEVIHFVFVTFSGKNIAIEFSLDEREGDVTCIVARVIDGKSATYRDAIDDYDATGVRVREHLSKLLKRHGASGPVFTRVTGLELHDRIKVTLADFSKMLKQHGEQVLNDSPGVLT